MGLDMFLLKNGSEIGYWRKANAVHSWFVETVQNGVDDCGEYEVSLDQLHQLRDLATRVNHDHELAPDLLPTQSGFFFGSTEYGPYYFQDIADTLETLTHAIDHAEEGDRFSYYASW